MSVVAVVPARGGSKGLPGKNLRLLGGHPLIAWSIAAGLAADSVTRVICSTDDEEIASVARSYGAEVPFLRPAALAGDLTPDLPVFAHLLDWLRDQEGWEPDVLVQLRPTTPLRPRGAVNEAVAMLIADDEATAVRSVCPPPHTPYKMFSGELDERGYLQPLLTVDGVDEPYNEPRQRLPDVLWHPGVLDVTRAATVRAGSMTGTKVLPYAIDPRYAIDIDGPLDFELAAGKLAGLDTVQAGDGSPWANVRLVVVDVDGTLTPGTAYYGPDGEAMKRFHTHDAHGLRLLHEAGVEVVVMTAESSEFPSAWARKVGVTRLHTGVADKAVAVAALCAELDVAWSEVCAIGDDWTDLLVFESVRRAGGVTCAVGDARPEIVALASHRCVARGGAGAVREVCDRIVATRAGGRVQGGQTTAPLPGGTK